MSSTYAQSEVDIFSLIKSRLIDIDLINLSMKTDALQLKVDSINLLFSRL